MIAVDASRLERAYQTALAALLAERTAEGHWVGELSTSALSTATAITALTLVQQNTGAPGRFDALIAGGLDWLIAHQNDDGGWGDTTKSLSNISTSMLVRATFELLLMKNPSSLAPLPQGERGAEALRRLEGYLDKRCGKKVPERAEAIRRRYGKDRTFAVPILTMCALAGLVPWTEVPPLPFELACFPQSWFRFLKLPVVSYALPALIAIGQAIHQHRPSWNPITNVVRWLARAKSLRVLQSIQPSSGGFLEATPLTSFVTMSLASIGQADHAVARKGVEFIVNSVRPDGSWPIDTNLATWVTTLSINALAAAGEIEKLDRKEAVRDWLLKQQFKERHPYTGADPGAWGWTDLPGSVPDADDTPGAILALLALGCHGGDPPDVLRHAIGWLLNLRNRDGGWPTFCRGWGHLPFDRSGPDLTAHSLRALFAAFPSNEPVKLRRHERPDASVIHGEPAGAYLHRTQRSDGSWLPLWFGNQHAPDDENPTYGTTKVLAAYRDLGLMDSEPARRGVAWLLAAQNDDGGWGGGRGTPSSIEETALAVEVLLDLSNDTPTSAAVNRGLTWLVQQIDAGGLAHPTPIGFYFAKLWYFEKLYPIIFSVAALGRARRLRNASRAPAGEEKPTPTESAP
jgi:squalene-hopene/tetraprenyl-beta-curcumene cyclase